MKFILAVVIIEIILGVYGGLADRARANDPHMHKVPIDDHANQALAGLIVICTKYIVRTIGCMGILLAWFVTP
jgi:hypothetical protein